MTAVVTDVHVMSDAEIDSDISVLLASLQTALNAATRLANVYRYSLVGVDVIEREIKRANAAQEIQAWRRKTR